MTLWLILLLIWLAGIPGAVLVTAAIGSRWYQHRASRAYRKSAVLLAFDARCGRRRHDIRARRWSAENGSRRATWRRPV
jgi:hypothetical protein